MSKRKYYIGVREVHVQMYTAIAGSEEDALEQVRQGAADCVDGAMEFSHCLDEEFWTVEAGEQVLDRFEITHKLFDGQLERTDWWAEDAAHAYEQWRDYAKDIGGRPEFHAMVSLREQKEV